MGYESKVYIVKEHAPIKKELAYGSKLAMFELCKMGYEPINGKRFWELFDQERTCEFYADDGETVIEEDMYGDPIMKADNKEVIEWLREMAKSDSYWRANALLSCLETLEKSGESYSIYHFGY